MRKTLGLVALLVGVAAVGGVMAWGQTTAPAGEAGVLREDLFSCKLPHGELDLPLPAPSVPGGYIVRLSDEQRGVLPLGPGKTGMEMLEQMRKERTGDIFYSAAAGGSFMVVSGKATDLGAKYLYEVGYQNLAKPGEIGLDPNKPKQLPGTVAGIKEGHTYLIECTDGHFALVRVLRRGKDAARVQYAYQPDGTTSFAVAQGALLPVPAEVAATLPAVAAPGAVSPVAGTNPAAVPGALYKPEPVISLAPASPVDLSERVPMPYLETHLMARRKIVEHRIGIVRGQVATDREIQAKADAMEDLGKLRAVEAVDVLVEQITFQNTLARPRHFSPEAYHPAVGALRQIGKPASLAALKAIGSLVPDGPGAVENPLKTTEYRLHLLTLVIKGVEGADVAEFLLRREGQKAEPAKRELYEQAIKYSREP